MILSFQVSDETARRIDAIVEDRRVKAVRRSRPAKPRWPFSRPTVVVERLTKAERTVYDKYEKAVAEYAAANRAYRNQAAPITRSQLLKEIVEQYLLSQNRKKG